MNPIPYTAPMNPAARMFAVTKSDTANLPFVCRMLNAGTEGRVVVRDLTSQVVITHENVPSGYYLGPFMIDQVRNDTTASNIVGYA
jgi:hypothetical protein